MIDREKAASHAAAAEKHMREVAISGSNRDANLAQIHATLAVYYASASSEEDRP